MTAERMAMTTAALRREDHRCVSAGGRERPRRPLPLPMKIDSFAAPSLAISVLAVIGPPCRECGRTCTLLSTLFGPVYSEPYVLFWLESGFPSQGRKFT